MGTERFQTLPGFRDFYPEDCAVRNYLFSHWRSIARRYAFVEYEGPVLEPTDLYRRKSGDEITDQLFCFTDKGEREVALRPELTPSLARMAAARARDFRKPLKWFEIGQCFRYEKRQKGRTREFHQFNCDILGEPSSAADAELVALAADLVRSLGFSPDQVTIRLSDRCVWSRFLERHGIAVERSQEFLQIIDKLERDDPDQLQSRLAALGTSLDALNGFIADPGEAGAGFATVIDDLASRGLAEFIRIDLGIVRGLAYYTGLVFEVFDLVHGMRAVAGGGRYDSLCELIGGRGAAMPACGFAMGDVVIGDLIRATPRANALLTEHLATAYAIDAYVVVADESRRPEALGLVQKLRLAGFRVDFPLSAAKVGRQFQSAEQQQARAAVVVGDEFPLVRLKDLASRAESSLPEAAVVESLRRLVSEPPVGPLLA